VIVPVPVAVAPTTTDATQSAPSTGSSPAQPTEPAQTAPSITSVSPNSVVAGNTVTVTIYGTNFTSDATAVLQGLRIITRNVVVVDSKTITAEIVTSAHTPAGTDPLTVKTSAGTSNTVGFTIE
jgi:endonuclease YncB( thermonuclease family)